jgi:hypothetical protein
MSVIENPSAKEYERRIKTCALLNLTGFPEVSRPTISAQRANATRIPSLPVLAVNRLGGCWVRRLTGARMMRHPLTAREEHDEAA